MRRSSYCRRAAGRSSRRASRSSRRCASSASTRSPKVLTSFTTALCSNMIEGGIDSVSYKVCIYRLFKTFLSSICFAHCLGYSLAVCDPFLPAATQLSYELRHRARPLRPDAAHPEGGPGRVHDLHEREHREAQVSEDLARPAQPPLHPRQASATAGQAIEIL